MRIGNEEREQAVKALGDHFSQGRLEPDEFEERMTAAYAARTVDDLDRLFDDLPRPAPLSAVPQHPAPAHPAPVPPPVADDPAAPYGREPITGQPYSDRSKVAAGLLQLLLPVGLGRLYTGHIGIGVAQLVLTLLFGIGMIWAFIDGIVILAGRPTDRRGRPLRP
jgi:TM2 domain-containing membrane protein YozV